MYRFLICALLLSSVAAAGKPNLLLITIDTLRADQLGCYGNRAANTPNLDALARESLFFENAVCQAPLTLPSHTSLMTGRYPYHHGVHDNAGAVDQREVTLAELLKQDGYRTYAFIGGFPLDHRFGLDQGFDVYNDLFPREKNRSLDFRSERPAAAVLKSVLETKIEKPFFVWVHFYDPHAPYRNGGYAGEIAYVDQQLGKLLQRFQPSKPIIAVAGDHGESLGEHGELTHRIFVYDSTMHVPFFIQAPGLPKLKIKQQVRLVDFFPTILSLMKIAVPFSIDGAVLPKFAGSAAFMESLFPQLQLGWSPLYAMRTSEWKFIEAPHPELYDLRTDLSEKQNVYASNLDVVKRLRGQMPKVDTEARSVPVSPEMAERLASLGYVSGKSGVGVSKIDPKDRIQAWNQIELAVDLEKTDSAQTIAVLERAQRIDPENPMVLGFLAQKYGEAGRIEDARKILSQVLAKDPRNSLALFRMGTLSLKLQKAAEAKKWAEMLCQLEASNADGWILLGRAHLQLGDFAAAISNFHRALSIDPLDSELRNDLGNLYLQTNDRENARKQFQQVLQSDPKNVQALNGLATGAFEAQQWERTERYLKQALGISPRDAQTKMNLALLYSKQNKIAESIALYREVESSPDTPADWKAEARVRLKELEP